MQCTQTFELIITVSLRPLRSHCLSISVRVCVCLSSVSLPSISLSQPRQLTSAYLAREEPKERPCRLDLSPWTQSPPPFRAFWAASLSPVFFEIAQWTAVTCGERRPFRTVAKPKGKLLDRVVGRSHLPSSPLSLFLSLSVHISIPLSLYLSISVWT